MTTTLTPHRSLSTLTFGGVLKSEAIKLLSLRSTAWCFALILLITVGLAALLAGTSGMAAQNVPTSPEAGQQLWVLSATLGVSFAQLVVAVLGALTITGEYGTGMIRSTLTAVPRRLPALVAKAVIIAVSTFIVSLVALVAAALLAAAILPSSGVTPDLSDAGAWWAILGGATYLALLSVLALAVGAIVRNSAGGIATILGLILVLPGVLNIFAAVARVDWARDLAAFLPDAAGGRMYSNAIDGAQAATGGAIVLEPVQGLLVMVAWVAAFVALASVMLKSRDV